VTPTMIAGGLAVLREHYGRHCLDRTVLYPGVRSLLARLRSIPLAIATNKPRRFTLQILAGLGIDKEFARVIAGDDVRRKKPHPEALYKCLDGSGVALCDAVVVGDSTNDIEAARAGGAVSVGVTYGLSPADVIAAAGPDHVVATVAELAALLDPTGRRS